MNVTSDPNAWVIIGLAFLLGVLVGMWMTAGGRRKWKSRYKDESARRDAIEKEHARHRAEWDEKEKEWRERDSLRAAAIRDGDAPDDRPL
jgi:hypothetical protein